MNRRKRTIIAGCLLTLFVGGILLVLETPVGADWLFSRGRRALPPPVALGSYVHDWHSAQVAAADVDHFVIYRHEWLLGGTTLGPYGRYHLQEITKRLRSDPFPVLIQIDHNEALNAARRLEIINQLLAEGIADARERVVTGYPQAEGLYGDEAARIFYQGYGAAVGGGFGTLGGAGGIYGGGLPVGGGLGSSFGSGFGGGFRGY